MPAFRNGAPRVTAFASLAALVSEIERHDIRALFTVGSNPILADVRARFPDTALLIAEIQSSWDALMRHVSPATLGAFDAIYGFSASWVDWWGVYQVAWGRVAPDEHDLWLGRLKERYVPVGFAEAEQLKYVDPAAVRVRLGLPPGRPVVLYLPFPFQSLARQFWPHRIHAVGRATALFHIARTGQWQWLPYVRNGWNDRAVVAAVRALCDRHGAALVVKSRMKNVVPRYLRRLADVTLYDEAYYPATILELLAVASVCIHYDSFTVSEAAYARVPSVSISPTLAEWPLSGERKAPVAAFSSARDGFYDFPGVVWRLRVPEAVQRVASLSLPELTVDIARRRSFLMTFFGSDDLDVGARILDDVARRLAAAS
jgi:hypothetical protein